MVGLTNIKKLIYWLFEEPVANTIPSLYTLDKVMNFFIKINYIIIRILFRIAVGKKKREKSQLYRKLSYKGYVNFSFYLFIFLYKIIRFLRLGNPNLIKIYVPKYKYKVYCPATIEDFINMTTREQEIIEHFTPKKNDLVIDIGAHLGRYALISSNRVGREGKVITIEANPLILEKLKKNLELNQITNTIGLNYAVFSEKTKIKLFFPREGLKNTIYNTIMSDRSANSEKFIEVNADTLDNILYTVGIDLEDVNWIKIDVEGAELEVLKGSANTLAKSKDISILIEIHNIEHGKTLYEPIINLLNDYNFKKEFEIIHESGERHLIVRKYVP
ncbi:MAG TPA: FkbM family methyltransferase [Nitrososphaeraceae archaeon]|nr:FkbM family methyltransferase [Nitrososphaeraceae archaeon]